MGSFLFSAQGRISRKAFWLNWFLPYLGVTIVAAILDFAMFPVDPVLKEPPQVFRGILALAALWPSIAINTKRLHDRGMTGWWQIAPLVFVIPLAIAGYWYYTAKAQGNDAPFAGNPLFVIVFALIVIAGVIGALYPAINVMFLRGQSGPNKYGEDPLGVDLKDTFA